MERVVAGSGGPDVLVNDAALRTARPDGLAALTTGRSDRVMETGVHAMFRLCRAALPHLGPGDCIIDTASVQAHRPGPHLLEHATTRGAAVTFTHGPARQPAPEGVRVDAVAPGPVRTPLIPAAMPAGKVAEFGRQAPIGRPAQPAETAPAHVFPASQEAGCTAGEVVNATGGTPLPQRLRHGGAARGPPCRAPSGDGSPVRGRAPRLGGGGPVRRPARPAPGPCGRVRLPRGRSRGRTREWRDEEGPPGHRARSRACRRRPVGRRPGPCRQARGAPPGAA